MRPLALWLSCPTSLYIFRVYYRISGVLLQSVRRVLEPIFFGMLSDMVWLLVEGGEGLVCGRLTWRDI